MFDNQAQLQFIPFIYQDKKAKKSVEGGFGDVNSKKKVEVQSLMVFDIDEMKVVQKTSISSNLEIRKHIRRTETGFCCFTLTRTSEMFTQKQGFFTTHSNPIF
jgi:hypothetical protein